MKLKSYIYSFVASVMVLFSACTPDEYDLGAKEFVPGDLVEGIAYSITHDSSNPNIVYLENLLGTEYTPLWEHPQGRSQEHKITLKMPFEGTYSVKFGIETRGGAVYGQETTFTINSFCADFVTDELWTMLTGGVGNSKKWFIDLDENGVSRYFAGPVFFKGTDDSWETITNGVVLDGADSWAWDADWGGVAGWQFDATAMDFGYMEFDLNGGSNLTTVQNSLGRTQTGKFMLDVNNHTIAFTDVELLHDATNDAQVASWTGTLKLLSLTENTMQIGVIRASDPCLLCFNYISEDYYNNWTPPAVNNDVVPELATDWRDYVEPKTNKVITYKLSDDTPFDWCNLDGSLKAASAAFTPVSGIEEIILVLNSGTREYSFTDISGNETTGSYTLSDEGIYTFEPALPQITLSADGRAKLMTNPDNSLRIMQYEVDDFSGALTDLWLASKEVDDQGNLYQYMGYHWVPQVAGATKQYKATLNFFDTDWVFIYSDPVFIPGNGDYTLTVNGSSSAAYGMYLDIEKILKDFPNMDVAIKDIKVDGTSIEFDDTAIDRGIGDAETTARRYILNPWGATAADGPKYSFTSSIAVTITVNTDTGTPFIPVSEE
ncbi:MAG: hypothetical protein IJ511_09055 [Bacteroides sp.]|nr:hypothetical protein [Bacteroides sp.]